jgi:hypothetical protein
MCKYPYIRPLINFILQEAAHVNVLTVLFVSLPIVLIKCSMAAPCELCMNLVISYVLQLPRRKSKKLKFSRYRPEQALGDPEG